MAVISDWFGFNIGTPYILVFMDDGSAYVFNVDTLTLTLVAPVNTFGDQQDITIWQGSTVLIVDTARGYFQWQVAIGAPITTEDGAGNVDPGLHSWAVTFIDSSASESNLGTNSIPLFVTGGSPPVGSKVTLTAIPTGPTGTTARKIYRTVAGNTGNFKFVATISDNFTTTFIDNVADASLGADAPSLGQIQLIDASRIGKTIATYAGRVWIGIRRTTVFSAPNSTTDFTNASAGGSFLLTDSSFIGDIVKFWASLDVLWMFGEASINQISNVNVGTGNVTTFSNVNISTSIGSIYPKSILTFLRQVFFTTPFGVYSQTGVTPKRLSSEVDGTISQIDTAAPVIGALGLHNEIMVFLLFCFYTGKPDSSGAQVNQRRPIMLTYFDEKWYVSWQGDDLTRICYLESGGKYRVFGTDGNNIYELFITPRVHHHLEAPTLDLDDAVADKEFSRLQVSVKVDPLLLNITCTPETETGPHPLTEYPAVKSNELIFIGNDGNPIVFIGDPGSPTVASPFVLDLCNPDPDAILHFYPDITGTMLARWQISNFGFFVGFDLDLDNDPFVITSYTQEIILRDLWGAPRNG